MVRDKDFQAKVSLDVDLKYSVREGILLVMNFLHFSFPQQEDNAIIEISLKLASIYAAQNR